MTTMLLFCPAFVIKIPVTVHVGTVQCPAGAVECYRTLLSDSLDY
jgi:hypothetical protein